jgi:dihydrolipoamide dehydrogenase
MIECDLVFLGTGERAVSEGYVKSLGVAVDEKGNIIVDNTMRTSVPNVYAVGDLIDGPKEMFKARKCGVTAARNCLGEHIEYDYSDYPDFLHSTYEVVWTGLSEQEARERYDNVVVIQLPPKGVDPRDSTLPAGDGTMFYVMRRPGENGLLKSVIDGDSRQVVGLHFVAMGVKNAFQYLDHLMRRPGGLSVDELASVNELFLNEGYPQLHRLRAGGSRLMDL